MTLVRVLAILMAVTAVPLGESSARQDVATTFTHPRGWFSFDMPQGWTVARQTEGMLAINPGLTATDSLDALIVVHYGEIEVAQRHLDLGELFRSVRPAVLADLRSQGIDVVDDGSSPRPVSLAHAAGIEQQWPGRAGGRDVRVWLGGLAAEGHYLAVLAVTIADKTDRFLPGAKRILHSVRPSPPRRDPVAERALEGAQFSASDMRPGGSFTTVFEFSTSNRIKKTMIASGRGAVLGGGASEEWGSYQVIGDEVRLSFRDETDALLLTIEQGRVVGLQRDGRIYRRR
jgi:hypothetical protein